MLSYPPRIPTVASDTDTGKSTPEIEEDTNEEDEDEEREDVETSPSPATPWSSSAG